MYKNSIFWAIPMSFGISLLSSSLLMAQQPVAMPKNSVITFPIPSLLSQDHGYEIRHKQAYGDWSILAGNPYASIMFQQKKSSLKLYITPSENMISIDVVAKKSENRDFKLPFITWNIKDVSVILNKTSDHKGWVQYSTAVYTQNIDKLVSALESESPMVLTLSTLNNVAINTNGLSATMNDFTNLIRQNNLIAPKPIALTAHQDTNFVPLDGMSPKVYPLYQQADYYVKQCLSITPTPDQARFRNQVCLKRNALIKQMKSKGWCWGSGDPDEHDKDKNWNKCVMNPKGDIEKIKENTKKDFDKAKAMTGN